MSYCTRCGAYIPQGENACPACGYDPEAEKAEQQQTQYSGGAAQAAQSAPQSQQGEYHSQQGSYQSQTQTQQKPQTQAMTWAPWSQEEEKKEEENSYTYTGAETQTASEVPENVRRITVLSYIGPFFLLPLLLFKDSEFARYHANQGLCLLLFELATDFFFGGLLHLASMLFSIYCVVLGAKAAASGKTVELPLIGKWRILKGKY